MCHVPLNVFLAAAEEASAIDDGIHHRVGHPEEKYPDEISVVDIRSVHERVDDKRHLANERSIDNEFINDELKCVIERTV